MPSSNPSLDEVRRAFRLLGECTELGADPILWRRHLAEGCSSLIDDHFVSMVDSTVTFSPDGQPLPIVLGDFHGGSLIHARFDLIRQFMESPARIRINPMVSASLSARDSSLTHLRREFVPDRDWYGSPFFQDYLRPLGLNDQVVSVDVSAPHAVSAICWLSYPKRKCTARAARLLNFLHGELTALKRTAKLAPLGGFSLTDLSPRQREILYGLFQGDSEKQLARRLGISRHTVHDYVKRLHRRLGARSRGELLNRCLRFWPALEQMWDNPS